MIEGLLRGAILHSQAWGMVWFGLLFWGSVFNASLPYWLSAEPSLAASLAAFAFGAAIGLVAKIRGRWL